MRWRLVVAMAASAFVSRVGTAHAHAFGERYDLPLPLELYLGGAAAAVAASFLVIGLLVGDARRLRPYPRINLLRHGVGRFVAHPAVGFVFKLVAVLLFVLVVATGYFGDQEPLRNPAPVLVWIIWWVGLAILSAFVGDLWAVINPWRTIFAWAETLWGSLQPGRDLTLGVHYPAALGIWPAVALILVFTWSELISSRPADPAFVASMVLGYSLLTWTGMFVFGRERWLRHGEVFSVVFGLLARFAPIEIRVASPETCAMCGLGCRDRNGECINCLACYGRVGSGKRELALRPYAVGLLRNEAVAASMVALVLLYLVSVVFDGVLVTPGWIWLEAQIVPLLPLAAEASHIAVKTLGLIGAWILSAIFYLLTCRAMAAFAGEQVALGILARHFIFTLVPIVIAYHLAHYLTYVLIQGQYVIPLASDPFGWRWDLFGTAGYRPDIGIVGARFAWYVAIVAIVSGHIVAVFLGHVRALSIFAAPRRALWSQGPLTALMVLFTVTSLSLLAEPIVQRTPAATAATVPRGAAVTMPADAVLPEPGTGRLQPVGSGQSAVTRLTYGAMASPFHDGTAMTAADLLYPFAVAYRWGARPAGSNADPDPVIEAATALLRHSLKGLKFVGTDPVSRTIRFGDLTYPRERLLVDVYLAVPADDVRAAAVLAPPWSPLPWHVIALLEEAVARRWAAFSQEQASRLGVDWLDPVRSESLKRRLALLVESFAQVGYVPAALVGTVTEAEARARWKALAAFHAEHGHFLATNGPYRIKGWSGGAALLEVVRDPRYPLGIGSYDSYALPRRAFVTKAGFGPEGITLEVEVDTIDKVMRDYNIVRRSLRDAIAAYGKGAIPACRYAVLDGEGKVILAGEGRYRDDGVFVLALNDKLGPGRYSVSIGLYPRGNTVNATIHRVPFEVKHSR